MTDKLQPLSTSRTSSATNNAQDAQRHKIIKQLIYKARALCGFTSPLPDAELTLALGVWLEFVSAIPTEQLLMYFHLAATRAKSSRDVGPLLVAQTYEQAQQTAERQDVQGYLSAGIAEERKAKL